ncbi:MAG TPA: TIGR03435 family protein, partial [Acidobacteriaceae bacterium]|nr:TIGR03435 family protein [Acidobacteriaceae bacterium]
RSRAGFVEAENCPAGALLLQLRYITGRPVLDKTGLTAHYHVELHWTPDNTPADSPLADGPSIFTAVEEQLGLKLEPATAPLDVLVIDSAQKPTPN